MLLLGVFSCASVTDCTQQAVPTGWGRTSWPSVLRGALLSLLQCGDINPTGAMAKPAVWFKLDAKTESQNTILSGAGQHWLCLEVHQPSTCSWVWGCPRGGGQHLCSYRNFSVPSRLLGLCLSCRLIKGDGEVLEEIVSKERHKEINKVLGTGHQHELHGVAGHSQGGVVFPAWGQLSPGSTARAPRVVLVILQPWAGSAVSAVSPLQQATRGDGLAFQVRTGMLQ